LTISIEYVDESLLNFLNIELLRIKISNIRSYINKNAWFNFLLTNQHTILEIQFT
ncbi:hypothetical protein Bpfe_007996, partial [Biomphalaria pfeifferi]